jgi:hypothetical protein
MKAASEFGNLHAVLVHESPECVSDLVANLRHLDPASTVLLYDGTGGPLELVSPDAPPDRGVLVHPAPRRMEWGRLHNFAFDVLRFALTSTDADAVTIVDSDQLALRAGHNPVPAGGHARARRSRRRSVTTRHSTAAVPSAAALVIGSPGNSGKNSESHSSEAILHVRIPGNGPLVEYAIEIRREG